MKMRPTTIILCTCLAAGVAIGLAPHGTPAPNPVSIVEASTFEVDPVHSGVMFRVKHLNTSYFYGRFNEVSGSFVLDSDHPEQSSFEFVVKVDSVDTNNKKRERHLAGPDFFNVKQFPTIEFKSTSVTKSGDHDYNVTGDLSLHGVTKQITVKITHTGEASDPWGGYRSGIESVFEIDRTEFGMTGLVGMVAENIRLFVALEGVRK